MRAGTLCCPSGACSNQPTGWARREFLKRVGLSAGLLAAQSWRAMAGPFSRQDFDRLVPADKRLHPDWVKSLTERGQRTVYRGPDLDKIGMPIGGLCAGQMYLGGDGRLWHWDIFNQRISTGADHYAKPLAATSPVEQGFGVKLTRNGAVEFRPLDRGHWRDISFVGEYPIGYVNYRDADMPVRVSLEAFSPFIPLNTDDSSLPGTILEFTVLNESASPLDVELCGWLSNPVCLYSAGHRPGMRRNVIKRGRRRLVLECAALETPPEASREARPDIVFDDFENPTYANWSVEGTAFGKGPVEIARIPAYQGDVGGTGNRVVNSHASAPGQSVEERDSAQGTLTSKPFILTRNYINFLIGGGAHEGKTCMNLLVDGKVVATATGHNDNHMRPMSWDVRTWVGGTARLQILDQESGPWGNIGVDDIVFSDSPSQPLGPLAAEPDFGTLTLALLAPRRSDSGSASVTQPGDTALSTEATNSFDQKLVGSITRKLRLAAGASGTAVFLLAWHMPNLSMSRLPGGRQYAARFASATEVTAYIARNFNRLREQTRLWHDTWYDSTLPYWFLDRTFLNTSILATSTAYRFGNGRFYGWEGVGCCEGTCGHVWQYAHAPARLFPEVERMTRENVDFGLALQPDGAIHFRGEFNDFPAIDAQAGAILRALREHQMASDAAFLKRVWPNVKRATEWLIRKDDNGDGLIESNQHNTLDTDWYGPVAWLSGLYQAALLAAETMARELGDQDFAGRCRQILDRGGNNLVARLFDGEYFINRPDPKHLDAINSGTGCEIDQVFGQSWAYQVGLPRVFPQPETLAALKSLWRYNFTPDVGPYRKVYRPGRWYAMPGEAGLLMCTFPRSDWDYAQAKGKGPDWAAGYFNECMNGFEYQAAGHMIWEGLVTEGLAVTRAVHDRYHASRRNPWNEVECGDHYARSMASYGVFLAACGFEYHGPKAHLGFAPRVAAATNDSTGIRFKSAFTTAQGWGTFSLESVSSKLNAKIELKWGTMRLQTLAFSFPNSALVAGVRVRVRNRQVAGEHLQQGERLLITLKQPVRVGAGDTVEISAATK